MRRALTLTTSTLAVFAASSPAFAQNAPAAAAADQEEIVVTGYRESVAQSLDVKRNLDMIADVISAEDIVIYFVALVLCRDW